MHLWAASKPRDVHHMLFAPTAAEQVWFAEGNDGFSVQAEDGPRMLWVAQLKPVHAQRVAEGIGRELARVGLDESEWLRQRGRKGKEPDDPTLPSSGQ